MTDLYLVTGAMAAGKSSLAQALAERLDRSVHLRGDVFRTMIVNGRARMDADLGEEARAQLRLRHDIAMAAARHYCASGFSVVYQDIVVGEALARMADALSDLKPRVVVLAPDAATLARRDAARDKTGYSVDFPPEVLADAIRTETPRIGLWLDTSAMTLEQTVDAVLSHRWPG